MHFRPIQILKLGAKTNQCLSYILLDIITTCIIIIINIMEFIK